MQVELCQMLTWFLVSQVLEIVLQALVLKQSVREKKGCIKAVPF